MKLNSFKNTKFLGMINSFYKIVMPIVTIILLLGVSQIINRPKFFGPYVDFISRLLLCIWLIIGYRGLFPFKKSIMYPTLEWTKADLNFLEKIYCIIFAVLFSVSISVLTGWTISTFVPIFGKYFLIPVVLNGIIFFIPLILQYEKFRIM